MKSIYKYRLPLVTRGYIDLPTDHYIIKAGFKDGVLFLWAEIETVNSASERVHYSIEGTGRAMDADVVDSFTHYDTLFNGGFVWHLYLKNDSSQPTSER
jgi:hypothetical protein